jgi:hypothetical protein
MSTSIPAVIVCIADNESGQHKEEIYSQIAMIDRLIRGTMIIGLKQVVGHHQHGSHSAQSVEDLVARF